LVLRKSNEALKPLAGNRRSERVSIDLVAGALVAVAGVAVLSVSARGRGGPGRGGKLAFDLRRD